MSLYKDLQWRGLVHSATDGLEELLAKDRVVAYIGFDPSAKSLHVGSLLPLTVLARLQRAGHAPIAILGGATGLIGDPSGKRTERPLLDNKVVEDNVEAIREQISRFLDFDRSSNPARVLNNAEWFEPMGALEFLRELGKHFTINQMLSKESVKRRLGTDDGLSFTEFSYMLLQAYDYLVLNRDYDCCLQLGGSDQWGNIIAGIELIRKVRGERVHGMVFPLVTSASGIKFGKTEGGAVWLDGELTSPFRFYQFWFNTDDRDVTRYLKYFTWLSVEEIDQLERSVRTTPQERASQVALARELTKAVHGEHAAASAERASRVLFGEEVAGLAATEVGEIFGDAPSSTIERTRLTGRGMAITDLLLTCGLASSKNEARRLITSGGVYLNNRRWSADSNRVSIDDAIEGRILVLRKGQKDYHLIELKE
ncbi:MAG: tyrosine--tRNA ligase [Acidobacteriota bacterium]